MGKYLKIRVIINIKYVSENRKITKQSAELWRIINNYGDFRYLLLKRLVCFIQIKYI